MFRRLDGCLGFMLKFVLFLVLLAAIGWGIINLVSCVKGDPSEVSIDGPNKRVAAYEVIIYNTGNVMLTNNYSQRPNNQGGVIYTLNGFWQVKKDKYVFIEGAIDLDEATFGPIEVRRRE